ncbi:MAG: NTP transferase domain-containing protein [Patescibacteria group bacterium]|nr:NTP transferase domain-containing protein [Patescibacteria group bacterium]
MTKIIILAAGKGVRMNSDLPKVLFPINGKAMIEYLIESIFKTKIDICPIVVVSPDNQSIIKESLSNYNLNFVVQEEQLGTGHAVSSAKNLISKDVKNIIVLYGDHPFITSDSIEKLLESHKNEVSMMTVKVEDFSDWRKNFYHWGRIVRKNDKIEKIIEFRDASNEIKEIKEVNPALFCFNSFWLWNNIEKLKSDNNQKEYYLTDLIKIAFEQNITIDSSLIDAREAIGINSLEELEIAKSLR